MIWKMCVEFEKNNFIYQVDVLSFISKNEKKVSDSFMSAYCNYNCIDICS